MNVCLEVHMRLIAVLTLISVFGLPLAAMAQDAAAPPPPDQPAMQPPPDGVYGAPPPAPAAPPGQEAAMNQKWQSKFAAANTSHDGHLTLQQAEAANLRPIVAHFSAIDTSHRGYVTYNEVMAWRLDEMAKRLEHRAAALRAQD